MSEAATNAQIKEIFERNERTVRSDRRKKTVGKAELWVTELDALLERIRTAEADKARLSEALRTLLDCPDIADNDDKDEETHAAERVARAALSGSGSGATHRHKKRGSEYVLIGFGRMQTEWWKEEDPYPPGSLSSVDMREVAIYRSVDDCSLWVRPREEFEDGRFVAIPAAPQQGGE